MHSNCCFGPEDEDKENQEEEEVEVHDTSNWPLAKEINETINKM